MSDRGPGSKSHGWSVSNRRWLTIAAALVIVVIAVAAVAIGLGVHGRHGHGVAAGLSQVPDVSFAGSAGSVGGVTAAPTSNAIDGAGGGGGHTSTATVTVRRSATPTPTPTTQSSSSSGSGSASFSLPVFTLSGISIVGPAPSIDPSAQPKYGSLSFAPGFQPDPYPINVVDGGSIDVNTVNTFPHCNGYASAAPTFEIDLTGTIGTLRLFAPGAGALMVSVNGPPYECSSKPGTAVISLQGYGPPTHIRLWVVSPVHGALVSAQIQISEQSNYVP